MTSEKRFTSEQLAERYGVKLKTIWTWKQRGYGPKPVKRHNRLFYREEDVLAWEREQETEQTA